MASNNVESSEPCLVGEPEPGMENDAEKKLQLHVLDQEMYGTCKLQFRTSILVKCFVSLR